MIFYERELLDDSTESKIIEFDFDFAEKLKIEERGISFLAILERKKNYAIPYVLDRNISLERSLRHLPPPNCDLCIYAT